MNTNESKCNLLMDAFRAEVLKHWDHTKGNTEWASVRELRAITHNIVENLDIHPSSQALIHYYINFARSSFESLVNTGVPVCEDSINEFFEHLGYTGHHLFHGLIVGE